MFDALAKQVAPELLDLLMALVAFGIMRGVAWVNAHTKNVVFQGVTKRLGDTVETVVREAEQTMVKQIRTGGLLSEEQARAVKEATLANLKTHLGPKGIAELKKVFPKDEINTVLKSWIEEAVHDLHAEKGTVLDTIVETPSAKVETKLGGVGLIMLVAILASGCGVSGTFEEARTAAQAEHRSAVALGTAPAVRDQGHCDAIDHRHEVMEFAAWMSGLAAGATGTIAGALQGNDDGTNSARLGLGISSGILAASAATTAVLSGNAATEWAHDCSIGESK